MISFGKRPETDEIEEIAKESTSLLKTKSYQQA
jgi:hypothetical protein